MHTVMFVFELIIGCVSLIVNVVALLESALQPPNISSDVQDGVMRLPPTETFFVGEGLNFYTEGSKLA